MKTETETETEVFYTHVFIDALIVNASFSKLSPGLKDME